MFPCSFTGHRDIWLTRKDSFEYCYTNQRKKAREEVLLLLGSLSREYLDFFPPLLVVVVELARIVLLERS